jgi:hypothetical protein
MRPVLDENPNAPAQTLDEYRQNTNVWKSPKQPATSTWENPWRLTNAITDTMFYL